MLSLWSAVLCSIYCAPRGVVEAVPIVNVVVKSGRDLQDLDFDEPGADAGDVFVKIYINEDGTAVEKRISGIVPNNPISPEWHRSEAIANEQSLVTGTGVFLVEVWDDDPLTIDGDDWMGTVTIGIPEIIVRSAAVIGPHEYPVMFNGVQYGTLTVDIEIVSGFAPCEGNLAAESDTSPCICPLSETGTVVTVNEDACEVTACTGNFVVNRLKSGCECSLSALAGSSIPEAYGAWTPTQQGAQDLAYCRCVSMDGTSGLSICNTGCGAPDTVCTKLFGCTGDERTCDKTKCTCKPEALTSNTMTFSECRYQCSRLSQRIPANYDETQSASGTGCDTNSVEMWVEHETRFELGLLDSITIHTVNHDTCEVTACTGNYVPNTAKNDCECTLSANSRIQAVDNNCEVTASTGNYVPNTAKNDCECILSTGGLIENVNSSTCEVTECKGNFVPNASKSDCECALSAGGPNFNPIESVNASTCEVTACAESFEVDSLKNACTAIPTKSPPSTVQTTSEDVRDVVTTAGIVSPMAATGSQRLGFLSQECDGELDLKPRWDVAPVHWAVGASAWRYYTGGALFAFLLLLGVLVLHLVVVGVYACCKKVSLTHAAHVMKLPHSLCAVFVIIAEPVGQLGTVALTGSGGDAGDRVVGLLAMLVYVTVAVGFHYKVYCKTNFSRVTLVMCDPEQLKQQCCLVRMMIPKADWMVTGTDEEVEMMPYELARDDRSLWWEAKGIPLYVDYSTRFRFWMTMEMSVAFLLGVCEALTPFLGCIAATAVMASLLLIHTVFTFVARPFLIPADMVLSFILSPAMTIAGFMKLGFVITANDDLADLMENLILFLSVLLLVRTVLDAINLIRKLLKGICGIGIFRPKRKTETMSILDEIGTNRCLTLEGLDWNSDFEDRPSERVVSSDFNLPGFNDL